MWLNEKFEDLVFLNSVFLLYEGMLLVWLMIGDEVLIVVKGVLIVLFD